MFNARWHEERSCFLEALCCLLVVIPCSFERFCLQRAAKECMQKPSNICFVCFLLLYVCFPDAQSPPCWGHLQCQCVYWECLHWSIVCPRLFRIAVFSLEGVHRSSLSNTESFMFELLQGGSCWLWAEREVQAMPQQVQEL